MPARDRNAPSRLYRAFDTEDQLLYVGVTVCIMSRLTTHQSRAQWFNRIARVDVEEFPSRSAALEAERVAIDQERPMYNAVKRHKSNRDQQLHRIRHMLSVEMDRTLKQELDEYCASHELRPTITVIIHRAVELFLDTEAKPRKGRAA